MTIDQQDLRERIYALSNDIDSKIYLLASLYSGEGELDRLGAGLYLDLFKAEIELLSYIGLCRKENVCSAETLERLERKLERNLENLTETLTDALTDYKFQFDVGGNSKDGR